MLAPTPAPTLKSAIDRFCFVVIVVIVVIVVAGFPRGSPPPVGKHISNRIWKYSGETSGAAHFGEISGSTFSGYFGEHIPGGISGGTCWAGFWATHFACCSGVAHSYFEMDFGEHISNEFSGSH